MCFDLLCLSIEGLLDTGIPTSARTVSRGHIMMGWAASVFDLGGAVQVLERGRELREANEVAVAIAGRYRRRQRGLGNLRDPVRTERRRVELRL